MSYANSQHRQANIIQKLLISFMQREKTEAPGAAMCAREWVNVEKFKREMRGLAPLRPASYKELLDAKLTLKRLNPTQQPSDQLAETEPDQPEPKESLNPQTVPAPPTLETPRDGEVLYNNPPHDPNPIS